MALRRPHCDCVPTATTSMRPVPAITLVFASRYGSSCSDFTAASDSPVMDDSSMCNSAASSRRPSAGRLSPVAISTTSPTVMSLMSI